MWKYRSFRRSPDSPRTPDEWVDALLAEGWELWCGRGARMDPGVYVVWLRRFDAKAGGPTREQTLAY